MKLKDGFVLRKVGGDNIVVPTGDTLDLNMMVTLNETGKFLWQHLQQGTTEEALVQALLAEYDVTAEVAAEHVHKFVEKLHANAFLI